MLVLYVWLRWIRLTTRTYGALYLMRARKPLHAACGRARRGQMWASAHGKSTGRQLLAMDLIAQLQAERLARA